MHTYCYRISIEGVLGRVGRQAFEEFSIVSNNGHTSLIAADLDQAALYGALMRIRSRVWNSWSSRGYQARWGDGRRRECSSASRHHGAPTRLRDRALPCPGPSPRTRLLPGLVTDGFGQACLRVYMSHAALPERLPGGDRWA